MTVRILLPCFFHRPPDGHHQNSLQTWPMRHQSHVEATHQREGEERWFGGMASSGSCCSAGCCFIITCSSCHAMPLRQRLNLQDKTRVYQPQCGRWRLAAWQLGLSHSGSPCGCPDNPPPPQEICFWYHQACCMSKVDALLSKARGHARVCMFTGMKPRSSHEACAACVGCCRLAAVARIEAHCAGCDALKCGTTFSPDSASRTVHCQASTPGRIAARHRCHGW